MRLQDFLTERISSQVFHYTRVSTAVKIVESGEFELSHTLGTSWEAQFAPKGYPYFLSTTRTRHGGYHGYLGQDAVLFELDGDFYNQRYPGKAVDYWNNRNPSQDHHKAHEAEDRIFSREPAIPAAIRVMDVYVSEEADPNIRARARRLIIAAKKSGIAVNFFTDETAWRMRDTRNTADVGMLKGIDPAKGYVSSRRRGYLKPWMELIQAKQKSQLSKDADSKRYNLQYTYDKQGLAKSLAVDLSNARKPGPDPDRNNAVRIIKFMQQNGLSTVEDLVNYLADKWKNIKEDIVTEALPALLIPVGQALGVYGSAALTALNYYATYEGIKYILEVIVQQGRDPGSMDAEEIGNIVLNLLILYLQKNKLIKDTSTIINNIPRDAIRRMGEFIKQKLPTKKP